MAINPSASMGEYTNELHHIILPCQSRRYRSNKGTASMRAACRHVLVLGKATRLFSAHTIERHRIVAHSPVKTIRHAVCGLAAFQSRGGKLSSAGGMAALFRYVLDHPRVQQRGIGNVWFLIVRRAGLEVHEVNRNNHGESVHFYKV
jgi:hypothetical protein